MGRLNTVLYTIDQRADTTEAEKKVARDNIGAISFDDVQALGSDTFKTKQYPIDMHFAANAIIDRISQNANGEINAHCNYIYNATESTAGLMSPYDKAKLDGIAYGAEVNVQADWNVTDDTSDAFIRNKPNLNMFVTHDELGARLDAKQDRLTPGRNITIENNVISATADPQEQADWAQTDSTAVDYIKNKPQNLVQDSDYHHTDNNFTDAEKNKLAGIEAGAEANVQADWSQANSSADDFIKNKPDLSVYATQQDLTTGLSGKQDTLTAGNNITITNNVISATADPQVQADWAQSNSSAVDYIKNKPANLVQDADYVHTDNNFTDADKTKLSGIEAGAEANVQADWDQANSSADDFIKNKPDLSVYATKQEVTTGLSGKQDTLTAGSNISIVNNVISADAAPQEQADWAQSDSSAVDYIKNKPQNLVQDASYVHTDNNFTTAEKDKLAGIAAGAEVNVQADWTEADSAADSFIKNKPNLATVATTGDYNDLLNKPSTASVFTAVYGVTTQAEINAAISAGKAIVLEYVDGGGTHFHATAFDIDTTDHIMQFYEAREILGGHITVTRFRLSSDNQWTKSTWSSATVAGTGDYNDLINKPTIPSAPVQGVEVDGTSVVNAQGVAEIDLTPYAKSADLAAVATSGSYNDLSNKPSIPAAQVNSDWNAVSGVAQILNKPNLAAVATSGDYNDLSNRPAIIDNYVCYIGSAKQALWNAWLGGKLIFFVTRTDLSQFAPGSYGKERIIPLYSVTPTQSSGHTVYVFRFARTSYVEEPGYSAVEQYSVQIDPSDLTGNLVGGFETVYERSFTVMSGTVQKDLYEAMTQGCAIEYMDGNHALYHLSAVIPDTGDTGYNFVFTRVGCSAAAGSPVTIDTATVRITSPSSTSAVVITANAPIGFPLMQWQQQTQGATNTYSADKLSINQDSHTVTMHDATNGDVDLGYVVPVVAVAQPTNKILTMASGNTVPTWSDAPEGHTVGFITVP